MQLGAHEADLPLKLRCPLRSLLETACLAYCGMNPRAELLKLSDKTLAPEACGSDTVGIPKGYHNSNK